MVFKLSNIRLPSNHAQPVRCSQSPTHPHIYTFSPQKVGSDGAKVTFALSLPANMPVGAYRVELEVSPEHSRVKNTFKLPWELVILFNPWCPSECMCIHVKDWVCYILNP